MIEEHSRDDDGTDTLDRAVQSYFHGNGMLEEDEHVVEWVLVAGVRGAGEKHSSPTVTTASTDLPMYVAKGLLTDALHAAQELSWR